MSKYQKLWEYIKEQSSDTLKLTYDEIGEAYAFIMKYAEENGYKITGLSRECYIDGIWNKDSVEDWLTEVQLPIE